MFERYTKQARRAVFFARYEAGCQRANTISTAHLLAGIIHESNTIADPVIPLHQYEEKLRSVLGLPIQKRNLSSSNFASDMKLEDDSKKALAYAAEEANLDLQDGIDIDHLLRGLLRFPNESAVALESVELNLDYVRIASKRHRTEAHSTGTLCLLIMKYLIRRRVMPIAKKIGLYILILISLEILLQLLLAVIR